MDEQLGKILNAIADSGRRDELVHRISLRWVGRRLDETINEVAGKDLGFVLILLDKDTGQAASTANVDADTSIAAVLSWLQQVLKE